MEIHFRRLLGIGCLFYALLCPAQDSAFLFLEAKVADNVSLLEDGYYVQGNRLLRLPDTGKLTYYDASMQGGISTFDACNPFKILLFSAPFQQLRYLDNRMNPISDAVSLANMGLGEAACVCASMQGGFWVCDRQQEKLFRLDEKGQRMAASERFSDLLPQQIHPSYMREVSSRLVVCDSVAGLLLFDVFGNYITHYPESGIHAFTVYKDQLVYVKGGMVVFLRVATLEKAKVLELPVGGVWKIAVPYLLMHNGDLWRFGELSPSDRQ